MDVDNTKPDRGRVAKEKSGLTANHNINDVNDGGVFLDSDEEDYTRGDGPRDNSVLPKNLTLDVGGRKFRVAYHTLLDYGYFRSLLSGKHTWSPECDGSYFLDADPDLFEHLLRYMRRPAVFPLFYSNTAGFDYDLYNRLEKEAESFQLWALNAWIRDRKYLDAVKVKYVYSTTTDVGEVISDTVASNESIDWQTIPRSKKVYLCPRQIPVHRGHPELCGAACHKRQAENTVEYDEEPYLQVARVKKEIIFDAKVCILD